jgi:hypothetical protein
MSLLPCFPSFGGSRRFQIGRRGFGVVFLALSTLALGSCSGRPRLYPAHGKLLVDEEPATGAVLVFNPVDTTNPKLVRPYGHVDQEGSFTLSSFKQNDGAPAGDYIVTVQWRRKRKSPFEPDGPDKLQGRYADIHQSDLHIHLDAKPNDLEPIRLTSPAKK